MGKHVLVNQPTAEPTNKIKAVGLAGVVLVPAVIWLADHYLGLELTETQAAVVVGLLSTLAGYVVKNRATTPKPGFEDGVRRLRGDPGESTVALACIILIAFCVLLLTLKALGAL